MSIFIQKSLKTYQNSACKTIAISMTKSSSHPVSTSHSSRCTSCGSLCQSTCCLHSTFNASLRYYAKKARVNTNNIHSTNTTDTSNDSTSTSTMNADQRKSFLIKPNKMRKAPKAFKKIINEKGLRIEDVTTPPTQHQFNPNEYYEKVENVLSDPVLKDVRSMRHVLNPEEVSLLTRGSKHEGTPLVDLPQMKSILDQDIKEQNETELQKPFRPSGNLLFVTLIRSSNHQMRIVKKSVHQLGLRKIHQTQVHADSPRIRGFVYTCRHLVHVKIVPVSEIFPRGIPTDDMLPEELRTKPYLSISERATRRSFNRRASKRDYADVEAKYSNLRKDIEGSV